MKKLLLINPPQPREELANEAFKDLNPILPSLGLMYLASSVREAGYEPEIYDAQVHDHSFEEAVEEILGREADLLGITCWTSNFQRVMRMCDELKQRTGTPIVLGGPHVTMHPQECIDDPSVDYIVRGEGEVTIVELMAALGRGAGGNLEDELKKVAGIGFKHDGQGILNHKREQVQNLDTIPFPAWDLVPIHDYRPAPMSYRTLPSVSLLCSRGCPFSCTFCDSIAIWTRKYRLRSVDNVLEEIWWVYENFGATDINFWDDLWGVNKKWALEFCRRLKAEGPPGVTWNCECRVDTVNPEMLHAMKDAGCWSIFYGIESMDQDCLDAINKNSSVEKVRDAVRWTKEAGIEVYTNFIVGLPNETPAKARAMLKEIKKLGLEWVKFTVLTPYPGTPLYDDIKAGKYGTMTEEMSRMNGYEATFVPYGYKDLDEVNAMHRWLIRRFHLRPAYILNRALAIRNLEDIKKYWRGFVAVLTG